MQIFYKTLYNEKIVSHFYKNNILLNWYIINTIQLFENSLNKINMICFINIDHYIILIYNNKNI